MSELEQNATLSNYQQNGPQGTQTTEETGQEEPNPLRSIHTTSFPAILHDLNASLVVSTYQAGKVVLVKADLTDTTPRLNTHFCFFKKPMGIAANYTRMAVGCAAEVWHLHNMPAVAQKTEPIGSFDACYVPLRSHITGDIDIHEMAFDHEEQLWLINTKFSCLCTLDTKNSFVPRWRPPFITALTPEDRCHLNGLAMVNGQPKYVTMLGESDEANGWRANKARGGLIMDITSNQVVIRGLSMPHSPRMYNNQLWVLESGNGSLAVVDHYKDPKRAKLRTIAELPGFTRGLDFAGPLAFVGLSQIRETAVFSGLPLTERLNERICGVYVIHIHSGEILAFLQFEEAVQEIFAVQVLTNVRAPDLMGWDDQRLAHSYLLPHEAMSDVPPEIKGAM